MEPPGRIPDSEVLLLGPAPSWGPSARVLTFSGPNGRTVGFFGAEPSDFVVVPSCRPFCRVWSGVGRPPLPGAVLSEGVCFDPSVPPSCSLGEGVSASPDFLRSSMVVDLRSPESRDTHLSPGLPSNVDPVPRSTSGFSFGDPPFTGPSAGRSFTV
ncbi:hypothetical protein, partial [Kitasatospora sp. SC0581]|uniref:hypothetical protein n=1 Tax=Kitasatospora sp. SC0581 TaxID=3394360 RepID=UPI003A840463